MNTQEIEKLLDLYYEGKTSREEEQMLAIFFSGDQVPEHLREHAPIFRWARAASLEQSNAVFSQSTLDINIPGPETNVRINSVFSRKYLKWWLPSAAASIVILLSFAVMWLYHQEENRKAMTDQQKVTEAYHQTEAALMCLSGNFNHGVSRVELLRHFDKAATHLESFSKFFHSQEMIINTNKFYQ